MNESNSANISFRFSHGTAKPLVKKPIVPEAKAEKELFWVKAALKKSQILAEVKDYLSNPDDSHGNHDVIVVLADNQKIGVQVTELTFEMERYRQELRRSYLRKIFEEISERKLTSDTKVVFQLTFPYTDTKKPNIGKAKHVVDEIDKNLKSGIQEGTYELTHFKMTANSVNEGTIYVPHLGNIGVSADFDMIPRSLQFYTDTVDALFEKKSGSLSGFLLIWSLGIWRDFHHYGEDVLRYMKEKFSKSKFDHVLFAESMDGDGYFQANLHVHIIKQPYERCDI